MSEYERGRLAGLQKAADAAQEFRDSRAEHRQEKIAASLIRSKIIGLVAKQHGEIRERETEQ